MSQNKTPTIKPETPVESAEEVTEPIESIRITLTPEARDLIKRTTRKALTISLRHDFEAAQEVEISLAKNGITPIPESVKKIKENCERQIAQLEKSLEITEHPNDEFTEQRKELEGHLRVGMVIEKLRTGQELEESERHLAAHTLEEQGWQKLLTELKPGDQLVSILVPSDKHVSIKQLNDTIFGPQKTDLIIDERKKALQETFSHAGLISLNQSYKDGYFKISDPSFSSENINNLIAQVNERVTKKIHAMLVEEKEAQKNNPEKLKKLEEFKQNLNQKGYEITFGVSTVGSTDTPNDLSPIELAVSQSMKGAILAREGSSRDQGHLGVTYSEEKMKVALEKIQQKRDILLTSHQNEIRDAQGHEFAILSKDAQGNLTLNIDLIRDIRKGKFQNAPEHAGRVDDIKDYLRMINILDIIKPFTHEEFSGSTPVGGTETPLTQQVALKQDLIESLRSGSTYDQKTLLKFLSSEGKDQHCTSAAEFHSRALQEQNCTYISIDVLDVGPGLLQEFDRLLNSVLQKNKEFSSISLVAGDATTQKMRAFRNSVSEIVNTHTGSSERPLMSVGGDEAVLAIPTGLIRNNGELLLALSSGTNNSRVIETTVGQSTRKSQEENGLENRKTEHLQALREAEKGAETAKHIEREIHSLRFELETLPQNDPLRISGEQELIGLSLETFAIDQQGEHTVVMRKDAEPVKAAVLQESFTSLTTRVQQRFEQLTTEYQNRFPNAGIVGENIRQVTKLENLLGKDSELFKKLINRET